MSKILVTGSSGFIAYHVIENLINSKLEVVGIDIIDPPLKHEKCQYLKKDVRDISIEELKNFDFIVHLAFITNIPFSIQNPVNTTDDNTLMTTIILDKAVKAGIKKFVFPSTASMYGNNPIPWTEDMVAEPGEPYSWQKLSCEYALKMWHVRYQLPTTILRLFQVYGENQRKDTALAAFIKAKKENKPLTLTQTLNDSSCRTGQRDFIYVKDIAEAIKKTLFSKKTGKGEIINIASGIVTSMEDIANTIGGKITFIPKRSYEVDIHQADTSKAKKLIDWEYSTEIIPWLKNYMKSR